MNPQPLASLALTARIIHLNRDVCGIRSLSVLVLSEVEAIATIHPRGTLATDHPN